MNKTEYITIEALKGKGEELRSLIYELTSPWTRSYLLFPDKVEYKENSVFTKEEKIADVEKITLGIVRRIITCQVDIDDIKHDEIETYKKRFLDARSKRKAQSKEFEDSFKYFVTKHLKFKIKNDVKFMGLMAGAKSFKDINNSNMQLSEEHKIHLPNIRKTIYKEFTRCIMEDVVDGRPNRKHPKAKLCMAFFCVLNEIFSHKKEGTDFEELHNRISDYVKRINESKPKGIPIEKDKISDIRKAFKKVKLKDDILTISQIHKAIEDK